MRNVAFWLRHHLADTLGILFIVFTLTFLLRPVVSAGLDRNQRCVSNAFTVSSSLLLYASDYDGRLPRVAAYNDTTQFQNDLLPYAKDSTAFRCPATGNAFYALNQAQGSVLLETIPQVSVAQAFRDPSAHPDGKLTIAYLDGHVERGSLEQPYPSGRVTQYLCLTRELGILTVLNRYAQAHNGIYPAEQDNDALISALTPYNNNSRLFECPDSLQPYILGTMFRGLTLSSIADRSPFVIADDPVPHRDDATRRILYLDRYLEQSGPSGIFSPTPIRTSMLRLQRILTTGLNAYVQDHQGILPVYSNYDEFEAALMPYIRASRTFEPLGGSQPFMVNLALSGTRRADYTNPSRVVVIQDVNAYGDGQITVGYLNGQVSRITQP